MTLDHHLTVDQFEDKYSPDGNGEHPVFTRKKWRNHVNCQQTLAGYFEWVQFQCVIEYEDSLKIYESH